MTQTPLCVVGGGSIGFRHMSVATQSEHIELTAVVEPYEARRKELQAMGFPAVPDIDAVPAHTKGAIVATPTQTHGADAQAALARGWACLVEKPITGTLAEGQALCDQAEQRGLALFTGHHRRCHPFSMAARDHLPCIGDLVAVHGLWSLRKHDTYFDVPWRRAAGAGPILTNLSHEIDMLRFLAGDIADVSAMVSNTARGLDVEDTVALCFRFESGALGSFTLSDAGASPWSFEAASGENPEIAASGQDSIHVIGSRGSLSFPSLTLWQGHSDAPIDWRTALIKTQGPQFKTVDPLLVQAERFAAVINGAQDDLLATGRDGLKTLQVTLATLLAAERGQAVSYTDVPMHFTGAME